MNVARSPEQIVVPGITAIETEAGTAEDTMIVIVLDVAGEPVAHVKLEVMITVITSPFTKDEEVKEVLVAPPTLTPFTCH